MSTPQQQEVQRSGRGEIHPQARRIAREADDAKANGDVGKVPEENEPGHHPEQGQDKPPKVSW